MSLSAHSSLYSRTGTPGGLGRWHDASQNSAQRGGLPRIPAWRVGVLHPSDLCNTLVRGERSFELFPIFFRPLVSLPPLTPTNQAQSHRTLSAQLSAARSPLTPWLGRRAPPAGSLRSSPAPCGSGTRRSRRSRTPRRASAPRPDSGDRWPRLGPCTSAHSNTSQSPLSSRLSCLTRPVWAERHPVRLKGHLVQATHSARSQPSLPPRRTRRLVPSD